ncbi:hypothetical protein Leryth_007336 [Lithospermum erythrorhizon]|nr:hypothetical protein Leryth_007336 [Lithospermum erythrorhizon]
MCSEFGVKNPKTPEKTSQCCSDPHNECIISNETNLKFYLQKMKSSLFHIKNPFFLQTLKYTV